MKQMPDYIEKLLKNLPKTPGVYQMKDEVGKVIYVGKSVNLKSRVSSYFQDMGTLTMAKKHMVQKIRDIETILCQTEVEALVLETNLIKHLTPKYNILMKDDKNLAYIKITNSPVPEVYKTRQKIRDGAVYFGPFTSGANIHESVKNLKRIFKIRNCRMQFSSYSGISITDKAGKTAPCMDYYIWLCPAPCLLKEKNLDEHAENIAKLREFLEWKDGWLIRSLQEKMQEYAKNLEFEKAAKVKAEIEAINVLRQKQLARDILPWDHDIFVALEKYEKLFVGLLQIRDGQILWVFRHTLESKIDEKDALLAQFLARQYVGSDENLPTSLILEADISDESLRLLLSEKGIDRTIPTIGNKKELLDFLRNQVREYAYKSELQTLEQRTLTREHMKNVLETLGYSVPKKWEIVFECYDISHTHGQFTYASRVCIANGKPDTTRYKKYKIKTLEAWEIDDFASHREVMMRRTIEWIEQNNFPHLIIIDWGKWQLSSAIAGIKEGIFTSKNLLSWTLPNPAEHTENKIQNLNSWQSSDSSEFHDRENIPPICSIAKREEEIFLPWKKEAIMFEKGTPELMVLQKARDESHRFSITANRNARGKSMKKNILEELPGIGPVTRKNLLKLAGSVDDIKKLSEGELLTVVNQKQLETLRDHGII